jgi:hypothetical protein
LLEIVNFKTQSIAQNNSLTRRFFQPEAAAIFDLAEKHRFPGTCEQSPNDKSRVYRQFVTGKKFLHFCHIFPESSPPQPSKSMLDRLSRSENHCFHAQCFHTNPPPQYGSKSLSLFLPESCKEL